MQMNYTGYFLIVGFGSIGRRHFQNLRELAPDLKIIILRTSGVQRKPLEQIEGPFLVTESLPDALKLGIRGAIIATPAAFHLPMAAKLVEAGIPVLIEKPLSAGMLGDHEVSETLSAHSAKILVGYNFRFSPTARRFRELIKNGRIGQILRMDLEMGFYLPSWRPQQDYRQAVSAHKNLGGGVLLELSHALDLYLWFFALPETVFARLSHLSDLQIDVEDNASLIIESEAVPKIAHIHLDMLQRRANRYMKVIGSDGNLIWNMVDHSIQLITQDTEEFVAAGGSETWNEMYLEELRHFLQLSFIGVTPEVTIEDGRNVMHLVEAARRSSELAQVVKLKESK
jgi:predicted dehydrogenase